MNPNARHPHPVNTPGAEPPPRHGAGRIAALLRLATFTLASWVTASAAAPPAPTPPQAAAEEHEAQPGALVIETLQREGRSYSANYGSTRTTYVEFQLLHRGRKLTVTAPDGKPLAAFRDAWWLDGAPRPTVLAGDGHAWYLISDGQAQATVATVSGGNEGTAQWLDTPDGPGQNLASVQVRSHANDARSLRGGTRLLLNGSQVLDVPGLHLHRLNLDVPAGYEWAGHAPLAMSPDGQKLVRLYRGASRATRDGLLVVADLMRPQRELLQVDLKALGVQDWVTLPQGWLHQHFEWVGGADGAQHLRRRAARTASPWRSRYDFGMAAAQGPQGPLPRYTLWPVRPTMLAAAQAVAIEELKAEPAPARPGDPGPGQMLRLLMSVYPVLMRYDAAQQALVVEAPELAALTAQSALTFIGEAIETQLGQGKLRQHVLAPGAATR